MGLVFGRLRVWPRKPWPHISVRPPRVLRHVVGLFESVRRRLLSRRRNLDLGEVTISASPTFSRGLSYAGKRRCTGRSIGCWSVLARTIARLQADVVSDPAAQVLGFTNALADYGESRIEAFAAELCPKTTPQMNLAHLHSFVIAEVYPAIRAEYSAHARRFGLGSRKAERCIFQVVLTRLSSRLLQCAASCAAAYADHLSISAEGTTISTPTERPVRRPPSRADRSRRSDTEAVGSRQQERKAKVAAFQAQNGGATPRDIMRSAEVWPADFRKWLDGTMKDTSVMAARIEKVLCGERRLDKKSDLSAA
jgi:hypothetical protein